MSNPEVEPQAKADSTKILPLQQARDLVQKSLDAGDITKEDAQQHVANAVLFDENRERIKQAYPGQFVAVAQGRLFTADTIEDLHRQLKGVPGGNRRYIKYPDR